MPQTLEQFREVPKAYRLALWGLLHPVVKSVIMRSTFEAAIATGTLTADQEEFLGNCIDTVSPEFYAENARLNTIEADRARALGTAVFREDSLALREALDGATALRLFSRDDYVRLLSPFRLPKTVPQRTALLLPTLRGLLMGMSATTGQACRRRLGRGAE